MTMVKICGLTNLEDALWAWRCGADILGFVFVPSSPRYVAPETVASILMALTREGCHGLFAGVFAGQSHQAIVQTVATSGVQLAQLHGNEGPEFAHSLPVPVIVARRIRDEIPWNELSRYQAWAYLLDSYDPAKLGGSGQTWNWDLCLRRPYPSMRLVVAGGLTTDNVTEVIQRVRPWGVDVSSGVEYGPGRKDKNKMASFIVRAKSALSSQTGE